MAATERRRRRLRGSRAPQPQPQPTSPAVAGAPGEPVEPGGPAPRSQPGASGPVDRRAAPPPGAHHGRPTPQHLAELTGAFALTAGVHDLEPVDLPADEGPTERGLRGLVGSGSSQVGVAAAMRARDASRPSDADLALAESELAIVRRGWVPREDLPKPGRR